jgi:hypothetical protein
MVGMNIPADATPQQEREFDQFYTHTHVPEVVTNNAGFLTGRRYELVDRSLNGPRFLAVYEVATEADAHAHLNRAANPTGSSVRYSTGPEVWQKHDTLWRLMYKPVAEPFVRK